MEYLLVHFTGSPARRVKIDGDFNGRTETLIQLEAGSYSVTLDAPADFSPTDIPIELKGTAELAPLEVTFDKLP